MVRTQENIITSANLFSVFLHDNEGQSILGIDDGSGLQSLTLELTNSSQQPIVINPLTDQSNSQYYHFELAFRSGTILQGKSKDIRLHESQKSEWEIRREKDSFYFTYSKKVKRELKPGERLTLTLDNISAEPAGGSRGTRVELRYQNLSYAETNSPISGTQLQYLNIINQRGSKQLPLYVGFIGSPKKNDITVQTPQTTEASPSVGTNADDKASNSKPPETQQPNPAKNPDSIKIESKGVVGSNRVLNDGTANKLILAFYYLNRLQATADKTRAGISLRGSKSNQNDGSKFKIAFDVIPKDSKDIGYGLLTESEAKNVKISIAGTSGKADWKVEKKTQGDAPEWIITCPKDVPVQPGEILQLEITNLITTLQAGYANLYIYYENIPGYWDGHIICPVEKGPLMLRRDTNDEESVGIGTDAPGAKLHVKQKESSSIWVATFEGSSGVLITGAKGERNALSIDNIETKSPALAVNQKGTGLAASFTAPVKIDVTNSKTKHSSLVIKGAASQCNAIHIDVSTKDKYPAIMVKQQGTAKALYIETSSSNTALAVNQKGKGLAAYFSAPVKINDANSQTKDASLSITGTQADRNAINIDASTTEPALFIKQKGTENAIYIESSSSEPALDIQQTGTGYAAHFSAPVLIDVTNSKASSSSLYIKGTHGKHHAININASTSEAHAALFVKQEGHGRAAKFTAPVSIDVSNSKSDYAALVIQGKTNEIGRTVEITASNPSGFVFVVRQEGQGKAAYFDGGVEVKGNIDRSCSRDLKENITPLRIEEATSTLEQLNAVKYDYKDDYAFRQTLGFIAEEMPDNLASKNRKTISPFEIIPILTKVLQEQQNTILFLQQEVRELNKKFNP